MVAERRVSAQPPLIEWDPHRPVFADVSHWHPLLSAALYAQSSVSGVIGVKISQNGQPADMAVAMVQAAEAQGLLVVGYQYGTADPGGFLRLFPPAPGRIACLDFEGQTAGGAAGVLAAEVFVDVVGAAYGRPPWFYAGANWKLAGEPEGSGLSFCPWWGAQYGPHLRVLRGLGAPVAWQYTDGVGGPDGAPRRHAGVKGACDMSCLLVSTERVREMAGLPAALPTPNA